jgi:hypothetical protein
MDKSPLLIWTITDNFKKTSKSKQSSVGPIFAKSWTDVMIFLMFAEKFSENIGVFASFAKI